jgi:uncharacterized repeat protein (TIGR01451 family)
MLVSLFATAVAFGTASPTFAQGGVGGGGGAGGGGGTVATGADLQVSGAASTGSPNGGAPLSYTFLVKNSGPSTADSVVLTDPVPTEMVPMAATVTANGVVTQCLPTGLPGGGAVFSCNLGDIAKGGQAKVVVGVTAPNTVGSYLNTGTAAASSTLDPSLANNSAGVTIQVKAVTGGICRQGVCDPNEPSPTPVAASCASLRNISAPVGYYASWAAIWNTLTVTSCSTSTETVNVQVTETNIATGQVEYDVMYQLMLTASQNYSMILDNDFAPFNTTYTVQMTVFDNSSGAVLTQASVAATTPPPR